MFRSLILLAALSAASLSAATLTFNSGNCAGCIIALSTTNWTDNFVLPLFDTNLGTLTSVQITLTGRLEGNKSIESLDAQPATVTSTLQATISLTRPDLSLLLAVIPQNVHIDNVTAFDGTIDFGGGSGRTYNGVVGSASDTHTSPPPAGDLALFSAAGGGVILLPVGASGNSFASGAGNLVTIFQTQAEAELEVVYTYVDGTVPEPMSMLLIGSGLFFLGLLRHRK